MSFVCFGKKQNGYKCWKKWNIFLLPVSHTASLNSLVEALKTSSELEIIIFTHYCKMTMTCSKWKMKAKCPSDVSRHSPAPVLCHSPCHLGATSWKDSLADHPNRRNQKDVTLAISVNSCKHTLRSLNLWDIVSVTVASGSWSKGENTDAQEKSALEFDYRVKTSKDKSDP